MRIRFDYNSFGMNKRNSQKKINGEILLMQTQLMSKLAGVNEPKKGTDELGFPPQQTSQPSDALLDLLSKSKNITQKHAKEIEAARKSQSKKNIRLPKEGEGTFLTGTGLSSQSNRANRYLEMSYGQTEPIPEVSDPKDMLEELIVRRNANDLEQLRRMIKETSSNLEGCSRKLNKYKRQILHVGDRYTKQMSLKTLNFMKSYEQFDAKKLEDQQYLRRY